MTTFQLTQTTNDTNVDVGTLVVFDDRVQDLDILYQALLPDSFGFTIRAQADGLETITDLLAATGAKYLAIVAHGEPGVVHLGKTPLNIHQLQAQSHRLQSWGVKEIALYSCELAKDEIGKDFIYQLSELTGATVAAAVTKTGSPTLGGNWDLTLTTGEITSPILFEASILESYQAVLPAVGLFADIKPIEGGQIGTFKIKLDDRAPAGGLVVNFTTAGSVTPDIDYVLTAGAGLAEVTANTFTIFAGLTEATLNVVAKRDAIIDPNEIISINTIAGNGYTISSFIPPIYSQNGATAFGAGNIGDFNGDGKFDLVFSTDNFPNPSTVSIVRGNGNGAFGIGGFGNGTGNTVNVGALPTSIVVGDFNSDSNLDFAATDGTDSVSVLLGDGNFGFSKAVLFPVGVTPEALYPRASAVGDFNGDGKLDLTTANYNSVSVLLGDGNGGFSAIAPIKVGANNALRTPNVSSVVVGDFNSDGKLDLAATSYDRGAENYEANIVTVLLGNGSGGFSASSTTSVGTRPSSVTMGDFNNDGKLDLATANTDSNNVSILLGDGLGGFSSTASLSVGASPSSVTAGDFNNDGKLDLATANILRSNTVSVLLGDGLGGFGAVTNNIVGSNPYYVNGKDFNDDGEIDLIVASGANTVSVLLSNYDANASLSIVDNPIRNDFNGDQKSDILWRSDVGGIALWQMNGATVTLPSLTSIPSREPSWKVAGIGDFNADTKSDILWRNDSGAIDIWTMDGNQVISETPTSTPSLDPSWKTAGVGDFTGDGKTDILWRNTNLNDNRVVLWAMDGANVVSSSLTSNPTLAQSWKAAGTGDFNGDGKSDILWRNDDGSVALWQMNGSNVSSKLTSTPSLDSSWKINGTADFSGDGKTDVLWRKDSGEIVVWTMDGTNVVTSQLTSTPSLDSSWTFNGTGDFSGDGKADILWRKDSGATVAWEMNGANILGSTLTSVQPLDNTWKVAAPIL